MKLSYAFLYSYSVDTHAHLHQMFPSWSYTSVQLIVISQKRVVLIIDEMVSIKTAKPEKIAKCRK